MTKHLRWYVWSDCRYLMLVITRVVNVRLYASESSVLRLSVLFTLWGHLNRRDGLVLLRLPVLELIAREALMLLLQTETRSF